MRHLLTLVSLLFVGSVWAEEKNEEPKADAPSLQQLLMLVVDKSSTDFLLNPSRFANEENDIREFALSKCDKASKGWEIQNENVPELIQQARASLRKGEIDVAQKLYLRYLRQFPTSGGDDDESFVYESAASWALPYAYLYASARKNVVELNTDKESSSSVNDAIDDACKCAAHNHFREGIKKSIGKEENPFGVFSQYVLKTRKDFHAAAKELQLPADIESLPKLFLKYLLDEEKKSRGFWDWVIKGNLFIATAPYDGGATVASVYAAKYSHAANNKCDAAKTKLCKPIYETLNDKKFSLHTMSLSTQYVEAYNARKAIHKALKGIEANAAIIGLSAEFESRLADYRRRQRIHYELIDNLTRIYVFDLPFALTIVGIEARMRKAESFFDDDESEFNQAGLNFVRMDKAKDKIVDKKFTHKKWMDLKRRLKKELGTKAWDDLKAQTSTLPDAWDMPDNKDLQDSGDQ